MSADTFTLNELKLAFINEDMEKLKELSKKTPEFSSIKEAKEMQNYLKKVNSLLMEKKKEIFKDMQKLKKLKKFQKEKEIKNFDFKG